MNSISKWIEQELVAIEDPHQPQSRKAKLENLKDSIEFGFYDDLAYEQSIKILDIIDRMICACRD